METCEPLALDAARQPATAPDEVVYKLQADVDLYDREEKSHRRHGTAWLSSHRLGWLDPSRTSGIQWRLSQVAQTEVVEGGLFGSPKIVVHLLPPPPAGAPGAYPPVAPARPAHVKLSFKAGGRDAFAEDLKKALLRRAWASGDEDVTASVAKRGRVDAGGGGGGGGGGQPPLPTKVGIAAVLEAEAARAQAGRALATTAFSDLEELVKHGKRVAEMAEGEAAGSLLAGLGIITPVTRGVAGSSFVTELARQLATFLTPRLSTTGGMAPLPDVFVAYNRARGTDPVSPEDLLAAARLLGPGPPSGLGLGLHLTTLPGGVRVIALDSFSPREVRKRMHLLLEGGAGCPRGGGRGGPHPYLTSASLSASLGLPLPIAAHHLAEAEGAGDLARDDSINGLRYYANLFA